MLGAQSSCWKAARSLASWSSDMLVLISSASVSANSGATRSNTAVLLLQALQLLKRRVGPEGRAELPDSQ
jgi:hypothetical protein